jgi:hypothetical protein
MPETLVSIPSMAKIIIKETNISLKKNNKTPTRHSKFSTSASSM